MGVAASEDEIRRDEQERDNLLRTISSVETAIAVSTPGTRRVLETTRDNVMKRVAALDKKIEEAKVERQAEEQAQMAAAAALAAKETRLSEEERKTYQSFLEKSYFTKKDFGKLDEFYKHSYDRLSEGGKDEMSKRIDEGIKRGEFKFDELPKTIQDKENNHAVTKIEGKRISEKPRDDGKQNGSNTEKPSESSTMQNVKLGSLKLEGVTLVDADSLPPAASMPNTASSQIIRG